MPFILCGASAVRSFRCVLSVLSIFSLFWFVVLHFGLLHVTCTFSRLYRRCRLCCFSYYKSMFQCCCHLRDVFNVYALVRMFSLFSCLGDSKRLPCASFYAFRFVISMFLSSASAHRLFKIAYIQCDKDKIITTIHLTTNVFHFFVLPIIIDAHHNISTNSECEVWSEHKCEIDAQTHRNQQHSNIQSIAEFFNNNQ